VDWEEHYNSRELHTTAMLIMHPDNERAMMMLLVDLTGDNRAGPITSAWTETSWLDPGWRSYNDYQWYENIEKGWFDMYYEFWSL
jgi:hypothetical protein